MNQITILTLVVASFFLITLPGSLSSGSPQQQADQKKCPTVEVKGPKRSKGSKALTYRARIKNLPSGVRPIYQWSLDGAEIVKGQGTDSINVDPFSDEVTATVTLGNVPNGCQSTQGSLLTEVTDFIVCRLPPVISAIHLLPSSIVRQCGPGTRSETCATGNVVQIRVDATDPGEDELLYTWSVTAGRLSGEGRSVKWDLSGVEKGTYTVTAEIGDGHGHTMSGSATLTVSDCGDCKPINDN